jgi:hypothetical protein
MSLSAVISLYAAKAVDGGQITSIRPADSRQGAVILRASSEHSTYQATSRRS